MKEIKFPTIADCRCGKKHSVKIAKILSGSGTIDSIERILSELNGTKVFVLCDDNTYSAAGKRVTSILSNANIEFAVYSFGSGHVEPDETSVGAAVMHFDYSCDIIVSIGSGVINDIGKILSRISGRPYVIVATAPSMDGYASDSSSMVRDGLKISLASKCPDAIIGDTDILAASPLKMMKSGLGDMLAKYVSICEWRISNLINGEYYCEHVASLVRDALCRCVDNADGLLRRDLNAVEAVFEGLVISGAAMSYAGVSRPASGVEHYFSHVWDMRALEFGTPEDFHGIQCAVGTLIAARLYEKLKTIKVDTIRAKKYAADFDFSAWSNELRDFLGRSAESMIALEAKEKKYDVVKHSERLEKIVGSWDEIMKIIDEELPSAATIEALLNSIDAPKSMADIGLDEAILPITLKSSKDIRDKYVLPRLLWDIGLLDEFVK